MPISGACSRGLKAGSRSVKAEAPLASRELDPQERLDWLRLCRTETIGPVTFYALLRRFGSARTALEMVPRLARRGERSKTVTTVTRTEAEAEFAALQRLGARLVCWG